MRSLAHRRRVPPRARLIRPALSLAVLGLITLAGVTAAAAPPHPTASPPAFGLERTILAARPAAQALDRANGLARALGLRGDPAEARTVRDTVRGRTFEEVTLAEASRHAGLIVHDLRTGRPAAVAALAWVPGDDAPRTDRAAAPALAARFARVAGLAIPGSPASVRWDEAADAWEVDWTRLIDGVPAPSDGLTVRLRPNGRLASLSAPDSPLAAAPSTLISAPAALAVARTFAAQRGLDRLDGFGVDDRGLAWSESNGFVSGATSFEPSLHLCRIVRLSFLTDGASGPSLVELRIDAGSGAIIGGDQTS